MPGKEIWQKCGEQVAGKTRGRQRLQYKTELYRDKWQVHFTASHKA